MQTVQILSVVTKMLAAMAVLIGTTNADIDWDQDPVGDLSNCWDVEEFPKEWFLGNYCRRPPPDLCLFYTNGRGDDAKAYAKEEGLITLWEVWPLKYYTIDNVQENRMRCIFYDQKSGKDRFLYFERMSTALAALCGSNSELAQVMDLKPFEMPDPYDVAVYQQDSFFYKYELRTMQSKEAKIETIQAINSPSKELGLAGTVKRKYWTRPITSNLRRRTPARSSRPRAIDELKHHILLADPPEVDEPCGAYDGAARDFDGCGIPW